jgi:hypothetical protein
VRFHQLAATVHLEAALVGGLFHFKPSARCRYWHFADKPTAPDFVAYWTNNGQRSALTLNRYAAIDPLRHFTAMQHCGIF